MAELTVERVEVRFGGVQALSGVDLAVRPATVHGLIGPNGAGKTTLFNVITGLQPPNRGAVRLDGRDITRASTHARARLGVGRTFQRLEICGTLTARENVQLAAEGRLRGAEARRLSDSLLDRVGATEVADEPADALPTGLARLVEVARALAISPSVLLLDEPSAGLNESETEALGKVLVDLAAEGMAVLLVEHDMSLVMGVCTQLDVLDFGEIIASGDPEVLREDAAVQAAYLGATHKAPDAPVPTASTDGAASSAATPATPVPPPVAAAAPEHGGPADLEPALRIEGLRAGYGRIEVLHGISLQIPQNAALALLGPNGAGKSTLLKVLSGCLAPTAGRVVFNAVRSGAPERLARQGVCLIPEGHAVFPNLTVVENLRLCTYRGPQVRLGELEERTFARFPVLGGRRRQLAGTLSGGEQQMLALARALYTDPKVLLLDEISMGLAPLVVRQLYDLVDELVRQENLTIVLVEQFAQSALAVATHAAVMVNGRIVESGEPEAVAETMAQAYLGS